MALYSQLTLYNDEWYTTLYVFDIAPWVSELLCLQSSVATTYPRHMRGDSPR
jgi:hypothetical protein